MKEVSTQKFKNLQAKISSGDVARASQISAGVDELSALLKRHKINSSEFENIKSIMKRLPSLTELGVFSAMWSEHCSYKSSRVHLGRLPSKGANVVQGPGENAGIVRLFGDLCLAFKMESHNHPSYIEPYQGAATGVGGILRDVFCMGARPIANLNCLRFGAYEHPKTRGIFDQAVKGIGDYGNCMGIPTIGGNIDFHPTYNGNCLVNAMTVGLVREADIFRANASGVGNIVIYVGSATGRDGIHGATMASDSFTSSQSGSRHTVQVGDPFVQKLLLEATLEVLQKRLVVGLQDMGAAGLTSSAFEMASRGEVGLLLDLDLVPQRAANMSAYELMLSESQERMLMVAEESKWPELKKIFDKWQLDSAVVGIVTDTGRVHAVKDGILEIDVEVGPITDKAPKYQRPMESKPAATTVDFSADRLVFANEIKKIGFTSVLTRMLSLSADSSVIWNQYDRHIGGRTVLTSDHGGAGVLWIDEPENRKEKPYLGVMVSTACNQRYVEADAKIGSALAVLACARSIAAAGGHFLGATDCLNFGNPEDPLVMQQLSDSVDGIAEACTNMEIPIVSGNVSLYNETDKVSIFPTPMIGVVGAMDDVRCAKPAFIPRDTDLSKEITIYLLRHQHAAQRLRGSFVEQILGIDAKSMFKNVDFLAEKQAMQAVRVLSSTKDVIAVRDVGRGGLALGLVKMSAGICVDKSSGLRVVAENLTEDFWFTELDCAYLVAAYSNADLSSIASGNVHLTKIATLDFRSEDFDLGLAKIKVGHVAESLQTFKKYLEYRL